MDQENKWHHKKWNEGRLRPSYADSLQLFFFSILMFAFTVPIYILKPSFIDFNSLPFYMISLFLLLGVFMFLHGIVKFLRTFRFRGTEIRIKSMPGVIGGKLEGDILLRSKLPENDIHLRIYNEEEITTQRRSGGKSHSKVTHNIHFEKRISLDPKSFRESPMGLTLPFRFQIPYGFKDESDSDEKMENDTRRRYKWMMHLQCNLPGRDMDLTFELPVYNTSNSDPSITEFKSELSHGRTDTKANLVSLIEIKEEKSLVYKFSGWPNFGMLSIVFLLSLFFIVPSIYFTNTLLSDAFQEDGFYWSELLGFELIFLPFCYLIALLMLLIMIQSFVGKTLTVMKDSLKLKSRLFLYRKDVELSRETIKGIAIKKSGSYGKTPTYRVEAILHEEKKGKRISPRQKISKDDLMKSDAEHLQLSVCEYMQLPLI